MISAQAAVINVSSAGANAYTCNLLFSDNILASYLNVGDVVTSSNTFKYTVVSWAGAGDYNSSYFATITGMYGAPGVDHDYASSISTPDQLVYRPSIQTTGTLKDVNLYSGQNYEYSCLGIWDDNIAASNAVTGDCITDSTGKEFKISYLTSAGFSDMCRVVESEKEGIAPTEGPATLYSATPAYGLFQGDFLSDTSYNNISNRDKYKIEYDILEASGGGSEPTTGDVLTFNGRSGHVVPLSGDYTPGMVGLPPTTSFTAASNQAPIIATYQYPMQSTGLLSNWTLKDSGVDTTGGRTLVNHGVTYFYDVTYPLGARDVAYFNGSSYFTFNDTGLPSGSSARSLTVRFKGGPGMPTNSLLRLIGYGTAAPGEDFAIGVDNTYLSGAIVSDDLVGYAPINDGLWHLAYVTFDGTTRNLYFDNVLVASDTPTLSTVLHTGAIGASEDFSEGFVGWMTCLRIYSHALSAYERTAIFYGDFGSSASSYALGQPLGTAAYITKPSGPSSQLLGNDGHGGFSNVTLGTNLSLVGETLNATQANSDWSAISGPTEVLNKPTTLGGYGITDAVPSGRTVNGKALSTNVTLTASDVSAVPNTRLVNGKQLNADISVTASDVGLGNVTNDAQLKVSQLGAVNGVCPLDSSQKVPSANLPAVALSEVYVVANQAAMLALAAVVGDWAVRTDISQTFVLSATPASTLGNWVQIEVASAVQSVNGYTGTVTLTKTDVGLGNVTNVDASNASNITTGNIGVSRFPGGGIWNTTTQLSLVSSDTTTAPFTVKVPGGLGTVNSFEFYVNNSLTNYMDSKGKVIIGAQNGATIFAESLLSVMSNTNNFNQINIQNLNSGATASSDFIATADNGTDSTFFVDLGINSSGYAGASYGNVNDSYLYANNKSLWIGLGEDNSSNAINFFVAGDSTPCVFIDNNGNLNIPANASTGFVLTSDGVGVGTWTALPTQVNADWNSSSGVSQILNKPTLAASATTDTTTTSNITDSTNKRFVTDAYVTVLSNTTGANSGDETATSIETKLGVSAGNVSSLANLSGINTGDQVTAVVNVTSAVYNATQTTGSLLIICNYSGTCTVNLPTSVGNTATYNIKNVNSTGTVIADAYGTEMIDVVNLTMTLVFMGTNLTLYSNNGSWIII